MKVLAIASIIALASAVQTADDNWPVNNAKYHWKEDFEYYRA